MGSLSPKELEMVLHYALGIASLLGGSRIIVAFIQRHDTRRLRDAVDSLHDRLDRIERATDWTAQALDRSVRAELTPPALTTPLPLRARDEKHLTPH